MWALCCTIQVTPQFPLHYSLGFNPRGSFSGGANRKKCSCLQRNCSVEHNVVYTELLLIFTLAKHKIHVINFLTRPTPTQRFTTSSLQPVSCGNALNRSERGTDLRQLKGVGIFPLASHRYVCCVADPCYVSCLKGFL